MNYKIFFKELFKTAIPLVTAISIVFLYAWLIVFHEKIAIVVFLTLIIIATLFLLYVFWIEPAYKKTKQEKPKCHWKVKWPRYNGDDTAIFQTECNETISGIREKCKCGKEVVVDL